MRRTAPDDEELSLRRTLHAVRRGVGVALLAAALAGGLTLVVSASDTSEYHSSGAVELTDDVASSLRARASRANALLEIEAQLIRLSSDEFEAIVRVELGADGPDFVDLRPSNTEDTPVIVVQSIALTEDAAERAVEVALSLFAVERASVQIENIERELGPLRVQREDQQTLIADLTSELASARVDGSQDEVSVLESRTAAALRRLSEYDVAIQEREFLALATTGQVRIVSTPSDAATHGSSPLARSIQAAIVTFVLALSIAVFAGRALGRLHLVDDVIGVAGPDTPILATIPRFRRGRGEIVVGKRDSRREAEAFRYMRNAVEVRTEGMVPLVLAITSAGPNEGKTVTSGNYALACARADRSVLIVDGDLLNPSVAPLFGKELTNSLPGVLDGRIDPSTTDWPAIQTSRMPLNLLAQPEHQPLEGRQELAAAPVALSLEKLGQIWQTIVVDCPPILVVSDAAVLARAADVTVLVVRLGRTRRRDLSKALDLLALNGHNLAGLVVTHARRHDDGYYGYTYGDPQD